MTKSQIEKLQLPKVRKFQGEVHLPGSKSISNRALLLAAMSKGETILENLPASDDVQVLLSQFPKLGIQFKKIESESKHQIIGIQGVAGSFQIDSGEFNVDNAGTALRPLVALLSVGRGNFIIDGNDQMRRRPIGDLVEAIKSVGVNISCSDQGTPPVQIKTNGWQKNILQISAKSSSQFVSALLMAAPLTNKRIIIELYESPVSKPYIDLTIQMMRQFGVIVENQNYTKYIIENNQSYTSPGRYFIEGDATAATYFMTAGLLSGPVKIHGLDTSSIQGDINYLDLIKKQGGQIRSGKNWIEIKSGSTIQGFTIDMNDMPDAAMTLAVSALFANQPIEIQNVENLRVKESERIKGLRIELEKLGAVVDEWADGLRVHPPQKI
ncbi:MAG: 3-phosphoshikimate 1-carboxyvinyltransferase, partial [Leptonema sp. (in: Bacteria)]|nr:3-phosphoshikimate 1-carboxyvinyltransferase [Leptonema sp. (in: bacteria)]